MTLVAVALAGAIGAPARYVVSALVQSRAAAHLPVGTFVVNVAGSFLAGVVAGLALFHGVDGIPRTAAATGFCGSFTTFSTFAYETLDLADRDLPRTVVLNVVATTTAATAAATAGIALAGIPA